MQSPTLPRRGFVIFAVGFLLLVWLPLMTAAISGGPCGNSKYTAEKQLRYCNFSLAVTRFTVGSWLDEHKLSMRYLERGILLADQGDGAGARRDMRQALDLASFGEPRAKLQGLITSGQTSPGIRQDRRSYRWLSLLIVRMQQNDISSQAKRAWLGVVSDVFSAPGG